jgi:predicted DNA-binding protein
MSALINISNYEQYALDYLEGTLNTEMQEAFDGFLALHPDLAEELDQMREVETLRPLKTALPDKDQLKVNVASTASIDASNYENFFVQDVEEMLSDSETSELQRFLNMNPQLRVDYDRFQRTILQPDLSVRFPQKSHLKRAIPLWQNTRIIAYRIAAVLVIALGSLTLWNSLQREVYLPRNAALEYTLMESLEPIRAVELGPTSVKRQSQRSDQTEEGKNTSMVHVVPARQHARLEALSTPPGFIEHEPDRTLEPRKLVAYAPSISEWVGEPAVVAAAPTQTLSLAQFVGQRVFGLDPNKTPTTRDVIRESIVKTIDDQEDLSLTADVSSSDRRAVDFSFGGLEFRRVSYK